MSWVNDQVRERIKADNKVLEESMVNLSTVALGEGIALKNLEKDDKQTKQAIGEIFKYYKIKIKNQENDVDNQSIKDLDSFLGPYGIMYRTVSLKGAWYKDATGPFLANTKDGNLIAVLPDKFFGYFYYDTNTGKKLKINKNTAKNIEEEAICFYKPFPRKSLSAKDLLKFMVENLSKRDIVLFFLLTLMVQVVGMIFPYINNLLFGKVVPLKNLNILLPFSSLLVGMVLTSKFIDVAKGLFFAKISTKLKIAIESATMARVVTLPASFFKNHSSGNLASRVKSVSKLCYILSGILFGNTLVAFCSLVYLFQIYIFAKDLFFLSIFLIALQVGMTVFSSFKLLKISKLRSESSSKIYGLVLTLLKGIQKIKLCGAEKRAFAKWALTYKNYANSQYNPPFYVKLLPAVVSIIPMFSTVLIYYLSGKTGLSQTNFYAFSLSFAAISGAFMHAGEFIEDFAQIKPLMGLVSPILRSLPECSEGKKIVERLSGSIELNQVTFRYSINSPTILDNISLKIRPGQYVAIVGRTGCGKSTLMRLLLGFEKPKKGAIYYDGENIDTLDLKSLRKNIGSVMQNGKLMSGSLFNNIVAAAPLLKLEDAWKAAELAGIDEEIKEMSMGMFTLVSEGSGGLSGGQKQRIMIARALAPDPKILFFDEATSALDNITQKKISDSLDSLKKTRIVIAHRLSTIKNCDRIIVLEKGKIVEDGSYEELINKGGYFSKLVERQRTDT